MNKQAVLLAPRHIEIAQHELPTLAPWEACLRVSSAGVCGTDLAIYSGDYRVPLPLVLGHEFSGVVIAVGSAISPDLVGKRCTAEINNSCISRHLPDPCEACRRGMPGHCQTRTVAGIVNWSGAFAEQIIVPADNLHLLPDAISNDVAVFIEPVAAALQTFEMAPLSENGMRGNPIDQSPLVVVLGVGRLGILVAAVAKALGARVVGVSRTDLSLDRARPYCDVVMSANRPDKVVTYVREQSNGLGADYVVEATASPLGIHFAAQLVRPRGMIALKSTPGLPVDRLNLTALVVNEVHLQGSRCGPFDKAIEFIQQRHIDLNSLISATFPLEETAHALDAAREATKVIIRCDA